ncbi:TPA: hypothetical protein MJC92_000257 [Clostridioides difficile]|uniref:hypothetical protein n=1 Tax=Clostridioides difficile TaxID=1496 RepID=UPI00038CBA5E|nr:hypothetical protein [Clostridioides difficile]EQG35299.1 hypothetical protein QIK_3921 [Clostridioides difficile DA00126]EQG92186.1 hypothetical protein QKK_2005 [Clostridioides difficile DA00191]MBY1307195.1 hypothetical protein [Clostridioides difficile]MCL1007199.1 hypothetical protein [Clostridioides difficile]MCR1601237.1 hypothetical protein [Clostridioides difficile]
MNKIIENKTQKLIETKRSSANEFLNKKIDSDDLMKEIVKMPYEQRVKMFYIMQGANLVKEPDTSNI